MVYIYVIMVGLLILGLFLFYLALKVIRLILKVLMMGAALAIILFVVFSFVVVSDIRDVKEHLNTDTSITLIEKKGEYVRGFIYNPGGDLDEIDNVTIYNDMTKDEIVEGHYKLIIMQPHEIDDEELLKIYEKPIAIFRAYKEGDILIYPELKTTKMIKKMPTKLIEKILEKE